MKGLLTFKPFFFQVIGKARNGFYLDHLIVQYKYNEMEMQRPFFPIHEQTFPLSSLKEKMCMLSPPADLPLLFIHFTTIALKTETLPNNNLLQASLANITECRKMLIRAMHFPPKKVLRLKLVQSQMKVLILAVAIYYTVPICKPCISSVWLALYA